MKNIVNIFILILFISSYSCKAQTVATLLQMEECRKRPDKSIECPGMENVTHVKDTDNRLGKFVGVWKGTFNGKQVELKLEKKEDFGSYDVKWDKLIGKIRVKDSQENVLFESFQYAENDAIPYGINFQGSSYEMLFSGISNCDDYGIIFIEIKSSSVNGSKMTLHYVRDGDILDTPTCPTLLPEDYMELTKQKAL